ncbi:MAG TPA: hypothetical protein VME70_06850 [Mycobacteriales bacterium]|nr:hypothetical protein [Mycobacteriales bacterium]
MADDHRNEPATESDFDVMDDSEPTSGTTRSSERDVLGGADPPETGAQRAESDVMETEEPGREV